MDSEAHAALAGMFDVTGYPTLKWMPKGATKPNEAETVKAPRSADGLAKFIADKTGVKPRKPRQVRETVPRVVNVEIEAPRRLVRVEGILRIGLSKEGELLIRGEFCCVPGAVGFSTSHDRRCVLFVFCVLIGGSTTANTREKRKELSCSIF